MIYVKFKNLPELFLEIDNTELGYRYTQLVKENYKNSFPVFRDSIKYTTEYMTELVDQAKDKLKWDWSADNYGVDVTAALHKDLERLLGANGFDSVTEDNDMLLHELHYCLHLIQFPTSIKERTSWLQIEWFNDSGFPLDSSFNFSKSLKFGQLRLQNPYVGHGPLQIYLERDYTNIPQTCKFHDFVRPGINIGLMDYQIANTEQILQKFKQHAPEFVEQCGEDLIAHYTGYPIIGAVKNLTDLEKVKSAATLELEYIKFDE